MTIPLLGPGMPISIDRLIETRMLIQANSGGGKSWAIRKLCELAYGGPQQIVIDVEGEFHTLRERFDYVLAGQRGGDCPADVKSAAMLARRLLELNASCIVDIYELGAARQTFVRLFLSALMDAPKELWHPVIVIVDEANKFCPENGKAEAHDAVIDLMTRGRKRGFCGVLATQRISDLAKGAAAECNNKLIGRCNLDIDMKRAAAELGFVGREQTLELRALKAGEFFGFGPALSEDRVSQFKVGAVTTTHHRAGQRAGKATPPPEKVKAILAKLADLPHQAAEEAKTVGELQTRVRELERAARKVAPASPPAQTIGLPNIVKISTLLARAEGVEKKAAASIEKAIALGGSIAAVTHDLRKAIEATRPLTPLLTSSTDPVVARSLENVRRLIRPEVAFAKRHTGTQGNETTAKGPQAKLLGALAWFEDIGVPEPTSIAVAFMAGYSGENGAFNRARGELRTGGLAEYPGPGTMRLTPDGRAVAPSSQVPRTGLGMRAAVLARLDGPGRKLLMVLIGAYPELVDASHLANLSGYGGENGAFNRARGHLKTLGLATYPRAGTVRAADILFPDGVSS